MIPGRCFFIVILVIVSNNDALLGSNHLLQPPSKEKIVISTGLYRSDAYVLPLDTVRDPTCIENAFYFVEMMNNTSKRYDRLYYLNQKRDRDKLRRSIKNYTCPMAMNVRDVYDHGASIYDYLTLDKTNWKCLIPERYVCDGFSHCLTDECRCKRTENLNPVLYCAQQPGCVTFQQVTIHTVFLKYYYSAHHHHDIFIKNV